MAADGAPASRPRRGRQGRPPVSDRTQEAWEHAHPALRDRAARAAVA